jgi:hypothetical protein
MCTGQGLQLDLSRLLHRPEQLLMGQQLQHR